MIHVPEGSAANILLYKEVLMRRLIIFSYAGQVFLFLALALSAIQAETTQFSYQGSLKDGGTPANANYDFEFALFGGVSGGTQLGPTNTLNNVAVTNGIFSVYLDFGNQFSAGNNRWLEIRTKLAGQPGFTILAPRQPLATIPYAWKSQEASIATLATTSTNASQLNGQAASFYTNATNIDSGTLNAARLPLPLTLSGDNAIAGLLSVTNTTGPAIEAFSSGPTGYAVFGRATSTTGLNRGGWFQSFSSTGIGVEALATASIGATFGGRFESASTSGRAVYGFASNSSGITYGIQGQSNSTQGFAGHFTGRGPEALYVENQGPGRGIQAFAPSDTAVWGRTTSGIAGVDGHNASTSGRGVSGWASAGTGATYGVYGLSSSTSGCGVSGWASAGTGTTYGVWGLSSSPDGVGVYGWASGSSGSNYGVYGLSGKRSGLRRLFHGFGARRALRAEYWYRAGHQRGRIFRYCGVGTNHIGHSGH